MNQPKVNDRYRNNQSGQPYKVLNVSDGEVVASMNPNDDGQIGTSMSWQSPLAEFHESFTQIK